jgi:hypothetical protein
MNLKSYIAIEVEKNDKTYHFLMPIGASYGEVYDAAFDVLNKALELSQKAVEQAKPIVADTVQ